MEPLVKPGNEISCADGAPVVASMNGRARTGKPLTSEVAWKISPRCSSRKPPSSMPQRLLRSHHMPVVTRIPESSLKLTSSPPKSTKLVGLGAMPEAIGELVVTKGDGMLPGLTNHIRYS